MDDDRRVVLALRAAGVLPVLLGLGYLMWRLVTPSECAWVTPSPQDWAEMGVRPLTEPGCSLVSGSTVTDAHTVGETVILATGSGAVADLPVDPSGPLVGHLLARPFVFRE